MPLFKRKPFGLAKPQEDLESSELVYQVRFTKEIFRDYQEYLNRINLYRERVWMCKSTGKSNLTCEEALVSEKHAIQKVQQLPNELVAPALRIIQYSMLSLRDLADLISKKLQKDLFVGAEMHGKKDDDLYPWRGKNCGEWESTCRSIPWVIHEKLAQKHGISTDPPEELRSRFFFQDGQLVNRPKKRKNENRNNVGEANGDSGKSKRKKGETGNPDAESNQPEEEPIKYPIDDLLVKPGPDDPHFTDRPSLSMDFNVPMDCVGDLLMDSNLVIIVETQSALLRLLIKDGGEYSSTLKKKKRKPKISLVTWTEYICDFLEMINITELCSYVSTIKRGHYGLLEANAKLVILCELVCHALRTDAIRGKLDELIEQRQALGATRRGESLEYARKKREENEQLKNEPDALVKENSMESTGSNPQIAENGDQTGELAEEVISSRQSNSFLNSRKQLNGQSKKAEKQNVDPKAEAENNSNEKGAQKQLNGEKREDQEKSKEKREQRVQGNTFNARLRNKTFVLIPWVKTDYNRYWWFRRDGRIFVESCDSKQWGYYSAKEEGEREKALQKQLEKFYDKISMELQKRSKDMGQKIALEEAVLRRSTRVRAPPRENPANAFLKYVNKWKGD
ncbi:DDT domain-containing protein, putative isoform 3 [Hibiscus syriacus]|uniref:DDT domain-containing protein, putative isoform 3 n=1 Tax=Hibiscus syriacus TaxID=106335 RepID=A0A6A2YB34_HIBSY|nr:DDT domain-containing protein, putative isoform 3 [Hibiscus syriacus]